MATLDLLDATNVLVGKPTRPLPKRRMKKVSALLSEMPAVREAHVLEVFAVGMMQTPRDVLFLVIEPTTSIEETAAHIDAALAGLLKAREHLDIWPVPCGHRLIATVRDAGCMVGWRD